MNSDCSADCPEDGNSSISVDTALVIAARMPLYSCLFGVLLAFLVPAAELVTVEPLRICGWRAGPRHSVHGRFGFGQRHLCHERWIRAQPVVTGQGYIKTLYDRDGDAPGPHSRTLFAETQTEAWDVF